MKYPKEHKQNFLVLDNLVKEIFNDWHDNDIKIFLEYAALLRRYSE